MRQQISKQNGKLQVIRRHTGTHSMAYHSAIASINARLQVGTTPGNPYMIKQWNTAQKGLTKIDRDISTMNSLANSVASTSTMSAYLLETTRAAYGLSGAVEADHRQLAILEDEVNRTVVLIERLLIELSEDINRQTAYVAAERSNLTTLSLAIKNGEILGSSLANRAYVKAEPFSANKVKKSRVVGVEGRRPLVRIRFDRPNVSYQQALYTAVNRALKRKPQAGFDLLAVASGKGSAAQVTVASNKSKRYAQKVLRSLMDMGLPLQRVRLSAMTSGDSKSNEVHLYVR
jgi:phosphate uptake regulator